MKEQEIQKLVEKQRSCFFTGATLNIEHRIQALTRLKTCIIKYEKEISDALQDRKSVV